jgi:O-antigen/teichoic acid export membrane protein
VLLPEENGLWLGLQLLLSYGSNLHLGALFGMSRSVPMLAARGEHSAVNREKGTSLTFVTLVAFASVPVLYAIGRKMFPVALPRHLIGTAALVVMSLLRGYYVSEFKSESRFADLSLSSGVQAVVTMASIPLIIKLHIDGLIASIGLQGMTELLALAPRTRMPPIGIASSILWHQLRIGLLALAISLGTVLMTTMDRTVMLRQCGIEATGHYFVGANIMILLPIIVTIPAAVITPQFFQREGRGEDLAPLVEKPVRLTSLVYGSIVAIAAVALGPTVRLLWPRLVSGNTPSVIAVFATCPLVFANLISNVYYAKDRQSVHAVILGVAAGASFLFAEIGVRISGTITGAVVGTTAAAYLYYTASALGAFYILGRPRTAWHLLAATLWPVAYAAIVAVVLNLTIVKLVPGRVGAGLGVLSATVCVIPLLRRAAKTLRSVL